MAELEVMRARPRRALDPEALPEPLGPHEDVGQPPRAPTRPRAVAGPKPDKRSLTPARGSAQKTSAPAVDAAVALSRPACPSGSDVRAGHVEASL